VCSILILQIKKFHHGEVRRGVVDDPLEKHDAIFEEHIAQGHLALPRVVAIALELRVDKRRLQRHGTVLRNQGPVDRGKRSE
jgi:hypothetical protein